MIAPLLPDIASDLSVDVNKAGLLVTVFALAYAVNSPILTTLTARDSKPVTISRFAALTQGTEGK